MKKSATFVMFCTALVLAAPLSYAKARMDMASEAMEPPPDPKKKKAGEECKNSDECQRHHSCKKDGDKGICTAPPRPKLPPGVVT